MEITQVKVRLINAKSEGSKVKAVASITIDDEFVVHDIKVIEGDRGLFIAMPSKRDVFPSTRTRGFRDIAHPIKPETRIRIQEAVLEKYEVAEQETQQEVAQELD
ncbi:MAG: septation regulator SpoVG [Defluviitaleaceae bacterium]|nr:septation regulator SpoVG [Defluviitaleaceae bacterium]